MTLHFGKQVFISLKHIFYATSIVLGIYLASYEYKTYGANHTFTLFTSAAVAIYFFEVLAMYYEFDYKTILQRSSLDTLKKRLIIFHTLIIPAANIVVAVLLLLSTSSTFMTKFTMILVGVIFYIHFAFIRSSFEEKKHESILTGYGADLHKLLFIFLFISTAIFLTFDSVASSFAMTPLVFIGTGSIALSIYYVRLKSIRETAITSFALAYVITVITIIVQYLHLLRDTSPISASFFVFIIFFIYVSLTDSYYETGKLETSILVKYLAVVILSTILVFIV
jgi:hypothetical protein